MSFARGGPSVVAILDGRHDDQAVYLGWAEREVDRATGSVRWRVYAAKKLGGRRLEHELADARQQLRLRVPPGAVAVDGARTVGDLVTGRRAEFECRRCGRLTASTRDVRDAAAAASAADTDVIYFDGRRFFTATGPSRVHRASAAIQRRLPASADPS